MANKVPLLTGSVGHVEDRQPHYVLVFPNPLDTKNAQLDEKQPARQACENLVRAFKLKLSELADPEYDEIAGYLKSVPWFSTDHLETDNITRREYITGMLSVILDFIHHYLVLDYTLFQSRDKDEIICRIYSKENWLRDEAEEEQYKLQFSSKTTHPAKFDFKSVSPYAPFETTRKGAVFNSESFYKHYNSNDQEVDYKSTSDSYQSLFTYNDKVRLVFSWLSNTLDLNSLQHSGIIIQHFCVHNEENLKDLNENWATFRALFKAQPLNNIRLYFGEKVAFYFSWMSMYMHAMIIAAVVGVITFIIMRLTGDSKENASHKQEPGSTDQEIEYSLPQILTVVFALFMSMWGSGFDQAWTRREKELAWRWGTINYYEEEGQRGAFNGEFGYDEISGKNKKLRADSFMYKVRKTTSYSVAGLFVGTVVVAVGAIFLFRSTLRLNKDYARYGNLICAMINAVQIRVMNIIYGKVAVWMSEWENHETETQYNDNLAVKLFLFKFVNSYISLFYIAFVQPYNEGCGDKSCMQVLTIQLITIFLTNLSLNIVELGIPLLKHYLKLRSENKNIEMLRKDDPNIRANMGPVESQSKLEGYESPLDDYMEMAIQYGYVSMFCASFQLLPLLAIIEIVLEIKVDSIKLCKLTKRPFPHRAEDIGVWKTIIRTIAFFSTLTNPAIIMFTSGTFEHMHLSTRLLIFLAIEHLLFLMRYFIEAIVPDTPSNVRNGLIWANRYIIKKLYAKSDDLTTPRDEVRALGTFVPDFKLSKAMISNSE